MVENVQTHKQYRIQFMTESMKLDLFVFYLL